MKKIKISKGVRDRGVVVGNAFDKYGSSNPIVQWMMSKFDAALTGFVSESAPRTIHEIGCGEGYWVLKWAEQGYAAKGSDFSEHIIKIAKENAARRSLSASLFNVRSIYDLQDGDGADLVVCCEVLEHLALPQEGLESLKKIIKKHLVVSVPREPLWRMLNMARGKYVSDWGNTPGHVQHWSKKTFINLISDYFEILQIRCPIPWTMLLCRPYR